ncbi:MAG TPA: HAMP domain-containing sensor histidine kinase [Ignavibacteriaceae bacterium]|nr:HAMP domain-containing sensor histidine kinase [Ignavibacteriaceae bacterium]
MLEDNSQNNKLQLLGKLNASFVHEIRNPLFALKLNLDYLKLNKDISIDIRESISACTEAVERIQFLVDSILDFSRKPKSLTEQCLLNEVSLQAVELTRGYAEKRGCEIIKEMDENINYVNIDKNKLLQVQLNLIINAIEASENKPIWIKTYKYSGDIFWEVEDNGKGIKEEEKDLIFKDFFTNKNLGVGPGLSICKELLNDYKAILNFDSQINKGSRFFIKFNSQVRKI